MAISNRILSLSFILVLMIYQCKTELDTLRVISILAEPFIMLLDDPILQGNDRFEGFCKDLADKLFQRLNRTYVIEINIDGAYGVRDINGSWSGMIGALTAGEADFAIADLTVSAARSEVVDFSVPFMQAQLAILLKKPEQPKLKAPTNFDAVISRQFSNSVWILIGLTVVITLVSLQTLDKCVTKKVLHIYPEWIKTSISYQILQFGFVIFLLFVLGTLAGNFLASKLASFMLRSEKSTALLPINSIQELGNQSKIQYGILRSGSTFNYFRSSMSDDLIESMYLKMAERKGFMHSYHDGIKRVRNLNGSFAFLMESHAAKFATVRKPCDLIVAPKLFGPKKGYAVAIPKGSNKVPLKEIDVAILDLNEQGILTDLENKWFKDQTECDEEPGTELPGKVAIISTHPLTLSNMESTLVMFSTSVAIILIFAVFEYFVLKN